MSVVQLAERRKARTTPSEPAMCTDQTCRTPGWCLVVDGVHTPAEHHGVTSIPTVARAA